MKQFIVTVPDSANSDAVLDELRRTDLQTPGGFAEAIEVKEHEGPAVSMWLNAFGCINVGANFAEHAGREVIKHLMQDGDPKVEALDPYRRITIEVKCS